ncbi:oxidoreductase [Marinithermofilum abyssi]|uniref:Oxidoreductase n=1 Tax=Marinithermofilum abyssi TaxID=1571185 RepID=A0A8J2YE91_9BACL|nr:SDR family oxidoreductase [Marinithermofilum abyssi]GGE19378.1 oxidoreductase [Marinithermofilum abyssi]
MNDRIVLITGASSGIGKEIARIVAARGHTPLLVARNRKPLAALQRELGRGECFSCDVTSQEDVKDLVEEVIQRYGKVDVLMNNAGYGCFGGALDVPIHEVEGMAETNYLGTVRIILAFLPHMLQQGEGRIVNIASVAGLTGIPNLAAYSASKFALMGFSESLRLEYSPRIQVGVLCPGPVQTPFFRGEDPARLFPGPIARQLLDVKTVAEEAVRLIDRPRVKVIPWSLRWAIRIRNMAPGVYFWATKRMYDASRTPPLPHPADGPNPSHGARRDT